MNFFNMLQMSWETVIPVVVLLGLLIFIHELGHFLVAKYYKVRVEVFSLGFGPKLLKYKHGDTVYALSAIPLGGYVKMFGDDPNAEISSSEKQHSFLHKPVGQRIAVVLAGPIMNLIFAFIVFVLMSGIGEPSVVARLGDIAQGSAAYTTGFRSGDRITGINGASVRYWDEVTSIIENHGDKKITVDVVREDGTTAKIEAVPTYGPSKNILSWKKNNGSIDGLGLSSRSATLAITPDSLAAKGGLKTGDLVLKVNDAPVEMLRNFGPAVEKSTATGRLSLVVQRGLFTEKNMTSEKETGTENVTVNLDIPEDLKSKKGTDLLAAMGFEDTQFVLAFVQKDSPADKAGLKPLDRILSINGQKPSKFEDVISTIQSYRGPEHKGETIKFEISRGSERLNLEIQPALRERMSLQGKEEKRFEIGIRPMIADASPLVEVRERNGLLGTISRGVQHTWNWSSITVLGIVRLFDGSVSSKNVGGLLTIGAMAKKSWQAGVEEFLRIMGIISINLFILNLLPVPVLDGGHLIFYSIEVMRGSPLPLKRQEALQQLGVLVLFGLMIFALYNDVSRFFFSS